MTSAATDSDQTVPSQTGRPASSGWVWLFLQPNNSQCGNCQIRNTRISTASVIPHARNPGEAPRRSFQSRLCHLFHLFYQVHIRLAPLHSSAGCFRYLHTHNSHRSSSSNRPAQPIALSQSSMKREHCGNFSVAHIVMSAEVLQRGRGLSPPRPEGRRVARGFDARGGTVVQATLSSFMHEQRKIPKERYSKSSDSTSSHNSADFKVSHDPQSDCLDLTWLFSS
jgi:hypothetical protein